MNSQDYNAAIHRCLQNRHSDDIIIPEAMCAKNADKMDAGVTMRRLDYWIVKLSWARAAYTGYEVKVSRQDFLRDDKAHNYEPQCHNFIWVTAPGVVHDKSEIPANHGWIEISKNGKRLLTKKKAPRLKVQHTAVFNAMKSAFMRHMKPHIILGKKEWFRHWLIEKEINRDLGHKVSKQLKEQINKRILEVEQDNLILRRENERLSEIKRLIEKHNIRGYSSHSVAEQLVQRAKAEAQGIPYGVIQLVERKGRELNNIAEQLRKIQSSMNDEDRSE